jgi:hypothetical protein
MLSSLSHPPAQIGLLTGHPQTPGSGAEPLCTPRYLITELRAFSPRANTTPRPEAG